MKHWSYILVIVVAFSCSQAKKQAPSSEKEKVEGLAKFVNQEEFHNFGDLQDGEVVSYSFWFKNQGDATLKITGSETDCGCIQLTVPEKDIMPGDSAYIDVMYNSAGDVGQVLKTVTLFTNADKKEIKLYIQANVKNKWIDLNN